MCTDRQLIGNRSKSRSLLGDLESSLNPLYEVIFKSVVEPLYPMRHNQVENTDFLSPTVALMALEHN